MRGFLGMRETRPEPEVSPDMVRRFSFLQPRTTLTPEEEQAFRLWWRTNAQMHGQGPTPDAGHFYDYRGAWKAAQLPTEQERHWSSQFKSPHSPERWLLGASGRVYDSMTEDPEEPYTYLIGGDE